MSSTAMRAVTPTAANDASAWGQPPAHAVAANEAGAANPLYYLDNFHRVLDWIGARYADLLLAEEAHFLDRFAGLPCPSRALLVRMIMRKGSLFRADKLAYDEVGCPIAASGPLCEAGWLEADPAVTLESLFGLCSKAEVSRMFALPATRSGQRKGEQLALLAAGELGAAVKRCSDWAAGGAALPAVFEVKVRDLCDRLRLLFFGNFRQDWSELILADMGVYRYAQVDISPASRGFRSRRDLDHYITLHEAKLAFRAGAAPADIVPLLPAAVFENDWLNGRRDKLLFQLAQQLEKSGDFDAAHAAYSNCRYPQARARAVRVLEKARRFGAAHQLLCAAMRAPESEAERQQLLRIAPRLTRQLGLPTTRAAKAPPPARIDLRLPAPAPGSNWWVEGMVRDHLADPAAPVLYVENALINSLFGLLCWDAIFSPLPGAFFNPYQRGPADLYSADFVPRRAAQFAASLGELDSNAYRATILANHAAHHGTTSPFVNWELLSPALLALALHCIAPLHLKRLFERMLLDLQANRSGFPDLIQFWPAEARYRMIEVKGPGDRLQDNQVRWLDYCALHRLPVAVCYLQWEAPPA